MKKKLCFIALLLILLTTPILANVPPLITIHSIAYESQKPVVMKDGVYYLSAVDLAHITLGTLTTKEKNYMLTIEKNQLQFSANDRVLSLNRKATILKSTPLVMNNAPYVPLEVLDLIQYPYSLNLTNNTIEFPTRAPYSSNSDSPKDHTFIKSGIKLSDMATVFKQDSSAFLNTLENVSKENSYIAFVNNKSKDAFFTHLREKLASPPYNNLQLTFRQIDTHRTPHTFSKVITQPVKVAIDKDTIALTIGTDVLRSNVIYMASQKDDELDLDKSIDATIMHMLYQYYRNTYDFKDDIYFSPFLTINIGRADYITYPIYTINQAINSTTYHYNLNIYRTHLPGTIQYVIDLSGTGRVTRPVRDS